MARTALGQAAGEVRRRGCEYLLAHPDPAHEAFLMPLLGDPEEEVVVAAIRAFGAAGQIQDIEALKRQFASATKKCNWKRPSRRCIFTTAAAKTRWSG